VLSYIFSLLLSGLAGFAILVHEQRHRKLQKSVGYKQKALSLVDIMSSFSRLKLERWDGQKNRTAWIWFPSIWPCFMAENGRVV